MQLNSLGFLSPPSVYSKGEVKTSVIKESRFTLTNERRVLTNDSHYERANMRFSSSSSMSRRRPKRASFFLRVDESSFFFNVVVVVSFLLMMGKYPRVVSGLTAIPSASWHDFVKACLDESGAEVTGECTTWASGNDYGTMPNWDTSLVEDMNGWTGSGFQGFGGKR